MFSRRGENEAHRAVKQIQSNGRTFKTPRTPRLLARHKGKILVVLCVAT